MNYDPLLEKMNFFATPKSWDEILDILDSMEHHSGTRSQTTVALMMVWNFAAEAAQREYERRLAAATPLPQSTSHL